VLRRETIVKRSRGRCSPVTLQNFQELSFGVADAERVGRPFFKRANLARNIAETNE
jgi:hypothetical protein